jgi:hypothetical protein
MNFFRNAGIINMGDKPPNQNPIRPMKKAKKSRKLLYTINHKYKS